MIIIEGTNVINLVIEIIGIMVCLFSLFMLVFGSAKEKHTTNYFLCSFFCLLVYYISLLLFELMNCSQGNQWATGILAANFATFLFSDIAAFAVSNYLVFAARLERKRDHRLRILLIVFLIIHTVLLIYCQASGKLALLDAQGKYIDGEWAIVGYSMVPSYMTLDLLILLTRGKNMPRGERYAFYCYLGLPLSMSFFRVIIPGVYLVALASICAMMIMFITIVVEQQQEYELQHAREEQMKVDLMLSQIQPHFLFNALYVIQEICHVDPETASSAIADFSMYLRHNMESIAINRPIPFEQELNHTKHYIQLQQLRFGKALDIRYDLQCTDFRIPTLTLQPIVENAIRYGIRQNSEGEGTIIISTVEHDYSYKIIVEDNGPGFKPGILPKDGLSHVGLENVRNRLGRVSGGAMEIESEPGKGTRVTMIIPKGD